MSHRAGNELAMAVAALRLASCGRPTGAEDRTRLMAEAIGRMEASAELHRLLARPLPAVVDAGAWLREVCAAVASSRIEVGHVSVEVDAPAMPLDGRTARRLTLVAAELVANACRHAVAGGAGLLEVRLRRAGRMLRLVVRDDGPGMASGPPRPGGGLGTGIVADLVRVGGGRITVATGLGGTEFRVDMPDGASPDQVRPDDS